jgi:hypothetical protein
VIAEGDVPYERGDHLAPKVTRAENRFGRPEAVLPLGRRCTATNRAGEHCKQWALPGKSVCKYHGGYS